MIKIKNLTYQPIRIAIRNTECRVPPRGYLLLEEEINDTMVRLEKKGLLRVKEVR